MRSEQLVLAPGIPVTSGVQAMLAEEGGCGDGAQAATARNGCGAIAITTPFPSSSLPRRPSFTQPEEPVEKDVPSSVQQQLRRQLAERRNIVLHHERGAAA